MKIIVKKIAIALIAAITLIGCNQTPPADPLAQGRDIMQFDTQFADIPFPANYKLNRNFSRSFTGISYRYGIFVYEGTGTLNGIAQFYAEEMLKFRWVPTASGLADENTYVLDFVKVNEACKVTIRSEQSVRRNQTIVIRIDVDSRMAMESSM